MYLKFVQNPHAIRTPLLATVANPAIAGPNIHAGWKRAVHHLRTIGVNLRADVPGPCLNNHKRRNVVRRVRSRLLKDRTKALSVAAKSAPATLSGARSKLDLFYRGVSTAPQGRYGPIMYSKSAKLGLISNTIHRSNLRHIRCGLVQCSGSLAISAGDTIPCSCDPTGATICDPTHVPLECPCNEPSRTRVLHALRHTLPLAQPQLRVVSATNNDEKLILASLGAQIPILSQRNPLYATFLQASAAAWYKEKQNLGVGIRVAT